MSLSFKWAQEQKIWNQPKLDWSVWATCSDKGRQNTFPGGSSLQRTPQCGFLMLSRARIIWKMAVSPKREENILSGSTPANSDAVTAQQMESLPEKKYCCWVAWAWQCGQSLGCWGTVIFHCLWRHRANYNCWEPGFAVGISVFKCVFSPFLFPLLWCLCRQQQVSLRIYFSHCINKWAWTLVCRAVCLSFLVSGKGLKSWDSNIYQ